MNGSSRAKRTMRLTRRARLAVLALALLIAGALLLVGCNITSVVLPTNVEAGTHYTMTVTINSGASSGFTGRMVLSIRVPDQWTVSSRTVSGAVTGSLTYSSTITQYMGTTWESKNDANHNGPKSGYKWFSYYTAAVTGVSPTDDAVITIVVNTHGQSGNFKLDFVPGYADSTSPTVAASNNGGAYWEFGTPKLDQAIHLNATVKPFVVGTNPPAGAVNVATSVSPTVTFSESMDPNTLGGSKIYVKKNGGPTVAASYSYNPASKTFTVNPNADLDPSTDYQIVVKAAVEDAAGNTMGADYVVGFTTAAPAPVAPQVIQKLPADGATGVAVGTDVTATFDQDMDATTVDDGAYYLTKAGSLTKVPAVVTYVPASKQAVIDPASDLDPSTEYTVTLTAGVKGTNGLSVQGTPITWNFTTAAPAPVAPQVIQKLPADGATGVAVGSSVSAVFDEDMNAATLTDASFMLKKSGSATAVPATVSYVGGTRTAVLDPTADLEPNTLYSVTLTDAVLGANGLAVQGAPVAWSFTTAAAGPTFTDVPVTNPYYTAIADLATRGIINGYDDGTFRPNNAVIRQQFAKMIVKSLGYSVSEANICPFTDVPTSTPGNYVDPLDVLYPDHYVAVCAAYGITTGKTSTTFDPFASITRQQLITMVARAASLLEPPASYVPNFSPSQFYPDEHYQNARKAAYAGLLSGLQGVGPSYNFMTASATRGECAQLLHNLIEYMP